jgi:cell division septation protein DedD
MRGIRKLRSGRAQRAAATALLGLALACGAARAAETREPAVRDEDPEFIVPVVALADERNLQALVDRLWQARIPYYVEPIATARGPVHRVRVGPFGARADAVRARTQLEGMGLEPGPVTERK